LLAMNVDPSLLTGKVRGARDSFAQITYASCGRVSYALMNEQESSLASFSQHIEEVEIRANI